jgi:manganese transport protein
MYRKILVALENSRADQSLLPHVTRLAKQLGSELLLVHVADGWVARNFNQLKLTESVTLRTHGLTVTTQLALGDPPGEILKTAAAEHCDLIAMTSHGHRLIGDIIYGSTINEVRHKATIPVLLVRAEDRQGRN